MPDAVTAETLTKTSTCTEHAVETGANVSDHVRPNLDTITLDVVVSNTPLTEVNRLNPHIPRGAVGPAPLVFDRFVTPLGPLTPKRLVYPRPPMQHNLSGLIRAGLREIFGAAKPEFLRYPPHPLPSPPESAMVLQVPVGFSATYETWNILDSLRVRAELISCAARDWFAENMVIVSMSEPRTALEGSSAKFSIELKQIRIVETRTSTLPISTEPRGSKAVSAGAKGATDADKKVRMRSAAKAVVAAATSGLGGG